ncbi:hypothetical protein [Haloarcula nitratireducens]|uniref:Uncharacterized protein n=1 Tax=Haloarcula nitratireducens TaxID=2487749 RepID=A0AAW4PDT3_9EURY|nr:hypothetical protein [Halomicroarcula nitratireducens]MBX0295811.1 hypothetical protein [Halomicroarcula nitratireducens]
MDGRGIAEVIGSALVGGGLAVAGPWLFADSVDWVLVVGLTVGVAIAAAANYRGRTGHAERVAAEVPEVTDDDCESYAERAAGDNGGDRENGSNGDETGTDADRAR